MHQVLLTHLLGSRTGQSERVEAGPGTIIGFGRDPESCAVSFDPERDGLASRQHARILCDSAGPTEFELEDLESSNGTFLDGQRIAGRVPLRSGQVIEFGRRGSERGPAVRFEVDSAGGRRAPAPTRMEPVADWGKQSQGRSAAFAAPQTMDQRNPGSGSNGWMFAGVGVLVLAVAGGGYLLWNRKPATKVGTKPEVAVATNDVAGRNQETLVSVEVGWKLYDPVTGRQAYHWHVANPYRESGLDGALRGMERVPVFVRLRDGSIEPVIMLSDERDTNLAMGGSHAGTGFVAHRSGFILTSRTLAAPWRETYAWPASSTPALLAELGQSRLQVLRDPPRWVPSQARFVLSKPLPLDALLKATVEGRSSTLDGRVDRLTVGFAGSTQRIAAALASISESAPIALLKVNQVNALPECPLRTEEADLALADRLRVLTWGGVGGSGGNARPPTAVTLSVVRPPSHEAEMAAQCRDCYWLSSGASAEGNIGAPVFDDAGKVAAIFQTARVGDQTVAFATPIRFGVRMMGLPQ
jgi:hypothetical protein